MPVWLKTEFLCNWDAKLALTNNIGSLGPLRAGKHPPALALWAPEPDFHSASVAGTTFEGSPIHFKFSLSVMLVNCQICFGF